MMIRKICFTFLGIFLSVNFILSFKSYGQTPDIKFYNKASYGYHRLVSGKDKDTEANWNDVITMFKIVTNEFPNSAKADDAQYSIGLCFLRQKKYDEAIDAFKKVITKFPKNNLTDDSQYLIGYSYIQMDEIPKAIASYQELLEKYPDGDMYEKTLQKISHISDKPNTKESLSEIYNSILSLDTKEWVQNKFSLLWERLKHIKEDRRGEVGPTEFTEPLERKITAEKDPSDSELPGDVSHIENIRVWSGSNATRLVVDLDRKSKYSEKYNEQRDQLILKIPKSVFQSAEKSLSIKDGLVQNVKVKQPSDFNSEIIFTLNKKLRWNLFTLENPDRIVVDFLRPRKTQKTEESTLSEKLSLTQQLGLKVRTIIIDPGHGGDDYGASRNGVHEKDLVLDIALKLKKLLEKEPEYQVLLTREKDIYVPLEKRTAFANQHGGDLFISIHINASEKISSNGIETYFLSFARTDEEKRIAAFENARASKNINELQSLVKSILSNTKIDDSQNFAGVIQEKLIKVTKRKNLGVKKAPFVVLIGANMPSILAEIMFVSNSNERELLITESFKWNIAEALKNGIDDYSNNLILASN